MMGRGRTLSRGEGSTLLVRKLLRQLGAAGVGLGLTACFLNPQGEDPGLKGASPGELPEFMPEQPAPPVVSQGIPSNAPVSSASQAASASAAVGGSASVSPPVSPAQSASTPVSPSPSASDAPAPVDTSEVSSDDDAMGTGGQINEPAPGYGGAGGAGASDDAGANTYGLLSSEEAGAPDASSTSELSDTSVLDLSQDAGAP